MNDFNDLMQKLAWATADGAIAIEIEKEINMVLIHFNTLKNYYLFGKSRKIIEGLKRIDNALDKLFEIIKE
ncbi:MAG: hypothetical protein JXB50_12160 [Spirochaetes bacterium]|nr:hypothetical protein [Spirochaetota bacterium]